jgi:hypothetical protein
MRDESVKNLRNVTQSARFLGISGTKLRELERDGEIVSVRFAGRVMFRPQDLEQFVTSHLSEAA